MHLLKKIKEYFGVYDLFIFSGIALICYGIYQIYIPGTFLFAGASLVLIGRAGGD